MTDTMNRFHDITDTATLLAAWHAAGQQEVELLNSGSLKRPTYDAEMAGIDAEYRAQQQAIYDAAAVAAAKQAITAALAIGYAPSQFDSFEHINETMRRRAGAKLAGVDPGSDAQAAACDDLNHVAEVLTAACDALATLKELDHE